MKRIICHWTAGGHKANATDKKHYHFIFEGDGAEVPGKFSIEANRRPVKGKYAAHTRALNTGSIGLSLACMRGAKESPLNFGVAPMTETQWNAMCRKAAKLCLQYGISVTPKTVLSHAEVQGTLGVWQRSKWDFTRLPFAPHLKGAKACGDRLREDVQVCIDELTAPKVAELPTEKEFELEEIARDVAAEGRVSTTKIASAGGGVVAVGTVLNDLNEHATHAKSLLDAFSQIDWKTAVIIILVAILGYIWWRRRGKQIAARNALS